MASCDKAGLDQTAAYDILSARKQLSVAEGYNHSDIYSTGGKTLKVTTTLLSEGMEFDYTGYTTGYAGNGYVLEIEFNSSLTTDMGLKDGTYVPDTLVSATSSGNVWKHSAFTYNPDNTKLSYKNGNDTEYALDSAKFEVSHQNDNYVIVANVWPTDRPAMTLTFKGVIKFNSIIAFLEPAKTEAGIKIDCATASYVVGSSNKGNWAYSWYYYNEKGKAAYQYVPLEYTITLTAEEGQSVVLLVAEYADVKDKTMADYKEVLNSGTYTTDPDETQFALANGMWNIFNSTMTGLDATKKYREVKPFGSYILYDDGVMYYPGYSTKSFETAKIQMNADGTIKSVEASLVSFNGTPITVRYGVN